jgi:hypothetical protein
MFSERLSCWNLRGAELAICFLGGKFFEALAILDWELPHIFSLAIRC